MAQQRHESPQPQTEQMGSLGLVVRLFWLAFGNLALLGAAAYVAKGPAPVVMDIVYFCIAIALVVVRYVDITRFKGNTSEGKPATLADWRRYTVMILPSPARYGRWRGWLPPAGGCRGCRAAHS